MSYLLALAAGLLFLFSIAPHTGQPKIWADLPSHFPLQIAVGAALLMMLGLIFRLDGRIFLLLFIAFYLSLYQINPYVEKVSGLTEGGLKILQANVLMLNQDTAPLAALMKRENPDIIVLMEVNDSFKKMLEEEKSGWPYQYIQSQNTGSFGIAVLSKQPMENIHIEHFAREDAASVFFTFENSNANIAFAAVHPANPVKDFQAREKELNGIAAWFEKNKPVSAIVAGDFNTTPFSPAFKKFLQRTGLQDTRKGRGLFGTFPAWSKMPLLRIPIDHILTTPDITMTDLRLGSDIGSDHVPLIATLALKKPSS
jgi:endonuclease/exonuclease/phosphatase (EEP) superfamily protein YafD